MSQAAIKLGCIADDFTGATDLANNLVRAGMRVVQINGLEGLRAAVLDAPAGSAVDQAGSASLAEVDAVVVALKTRTIPAVQAIDQSLQALRWLQAQGAQQIYFKYCSTFDSTADGNIGPVAEALMQALGTDFTIATPAFPDNGRTVFKGHLFVGDVLLHESGMQHHPLTPMTDANLVRVLQAQCQRKVGLIDYKVVAQGEAAIRARVQALREQGFGLAVVDALSNADLLVLGRALASMPLVTAGSGVAIGLPQNFGLPQNLGPGVGGELASASQLPAPQGRQAIVCGSCSLATQAQVRAFEAEHGTVFRVDPLALAQGQPVAAQALAWAQQHWEAGCTSPLLFVSTADAAAVQAVQQQLGGAQAGALVEQALAAISVGLVRAGVGQLIVAGGETSGACVQALGVSMLRIGPQIDPGVPWCHAVCRLPADAAGLAAGSQPAIPAIPAIHLALKSGNFGTEDFFIKAWSML